MRRGERFPDDQAEVVFCDAFVQQLGELTESEREHVLGDVVRLCPGPVLAAFVELATPDNTEPADRSANMRAGAANALNGWG
jgi:hypothetical protein